LIASDPGLVLRIGDGDLLAVCIFSIKGFGGCLVDSFNKVKDPGTRSAGMTRAFQMRAFSRVRGCDGGDPSAAARAVADMAVDEAIRGRDV
jgi:hypothetical protein